MDIDRALCWFLVVDKNIISQSGDEHVNRLLGKQGLGARAQLYIT